MPTVSSGIIGNANLVNPKEIPVKRIRSEINLFLVPGGEVIQAFQTVRDQVIFTDRRVIAVNVQGITGKRLRISLIHTQRCSTLVWKPQVFWTSTVN